MQRRLLMKFAVAFVGLIAIGFLWRSIPPHQFVEPASKFMICNNNLKQIGIALHAYHGQHDTFPPAFVPDQDGKPAHSWRVLILPFLGQQQLYDKYRFDERWDGPNNVRLSGMMPSIYRCPSFSVNQSNEHLTNYMAIVTSNSVIAGETSTSMSAITDSYDSTILVTESTTRPVHWMSPEDLQFDDAFGDLESGLCPHSKGSSVLLVDGSVQFLPQQITQDELSAIVTRSGGEGDVDLPSHP